MDSEVKILPGRARSSGEFAVPSAYRLRFPPHWRAEPVGNRSASAIAEGTIAWLNTYGIGLSGADREKLRKFDCGKYGGYSLPTAPFAEALLVTQYISLWLFWDDVEVEDHVAWSIEDVVEALTTGRHAAAHGRYVAAWADLGDRLRQNRSDDWMRRLATTMREWLENAKVETAMARALRDRGVWPESATLLECRTISIGMYPTFHLVEFTENIELPQEFHEHPAVRSLKRTASRLVGMGNDLGGVAKDVLNRWLNLVLALAQSSSLGIDEAFGRIVELHNREVLEFDRIARSLPRFGPKIEPFVLRWIQAVRHSVYGFALWESLAERYQEYTAIVGRKALIASITSTEDKRPPSSAQLASAAARSPERDREA